MIYNEREIEKAERIFNDLESRGKVAVLAMVQNRLVASSQKEDYSTCPTTQQALEELLDWLHYVLSQELENLGAWMEIEYPEIPLGLLEQLSHPNRRVPT